MSSENQTFAYRVLVVDDEPSIVQTALLVLGTRGYEVHGAKDGFEALTALSRSLPDLLISDLSMPNMSGFELLSIVRRRFPQLPVIAISGQYNSTAPAGLIADAFFSKGLYSQEELFERITELLEQSPLRPHVARPERAPLWVPRSSMGYFVVTCTNCLRSFSVEDSGGKEEYRESECLHCGSTVCYLADLSGLKAPCQTTKRVPDRVRSR
jgi:CheY-like chemotaxis protein